MHFTLCSCWFIRDATVIVAQHQGPMGKKCEWGREACWTWWVKGWRSMRKRDCLRSVVLLVNEGWRRKRYRTKRKNKCCPGYKSVITHFLTSPPYPQNSPYQPDDWITSCTWNIDKFTCETVSCIAEKRFSLDSVGFKLTQWDADLCFLVLKSYFFLFQVLLSGLIGVVSWKRPLSLVVRKMTYSYSNRHVVF